MNSPSKHRYSARRRTLVLSIALTAVAAALFSFAAGYGGHPWWRVGPGHHASDDFVASFVGPWYGHTHDRACPGPVGIVINESCYERYYAGSPLSLYGGYPPYSYYSYPYGGYPAASGITNITSIYVNGGEPVINVMNIYG